MGAESMPSDSLIRLTLASAKLAHRAPGRPRHDGPAKVTGPPFVRSAAATPRPCSAVGSLVVPALLAEPLDDLARQMAAQPEPPRGGAPLIAMHLAVLVGRLMPSVGWAAAERHADGEPVWTGRSHPYDESTVRKRARDFAARGGTELVARALEVSVEQAVAASGEKAIAYTDMFDQVYWTKKPAYAAPIASRGKRLLAATYFGLTFVRVGEATALAYHVSWHKPASPLQDALEAVRDAPRREAWLTRNLRLHIWDRGGSGRPTVRWALARRIPYLTVMQGSTSWARYRRSPRVYTRTRVPVFVRRDVAVARGSPPGSSPEVVVYPAHPEKGRRATKALRYRCGVPLPKLAEGPLRRRHVHQAEGLRISGRRQHIQHLQYPGAAAHRDRQGAAAPQIELAGGAVAQQNAVACEQFGQVRADLADERRLQRGGAKRVEAQHFERVASAGQCHLEFEHRACHGNGRVTRQLHEQILGIAVAWSAYHHIGVAEQALGRRSELGERGRVGQIHRGAERHAERDGEHGDQQPYWLFAQLCHDQHPPDRE